MVGGVSVTSGFKHILLDASAGSQRRSLIRLSGADAAHVLVNFPGATDLTIGAFQFNASLLAPFATLHYSHGDLHGTVVVARLDGDVELRADGIFGGTIAVVTGCEGEPPAEDTSGR